MNPYTISSIIISLAAIISYLNHRYIKMQGTIAVMIGSITISLILLLLKHAGITDVTQQIETLLIRTDFHNLLLKGMLGFLLFAGSMTIDFSAMREQKWEIGTLASLSTIASAIIVGVAVYYLLPLLNLHLPFLYCLLFGALISPTDPIAVLATFKRIGAPKSLEVSVAGESLFNDGVGIVIFLTIYQLAFNHTAITWSNIALLFLRQAGGGIAYGIVLGLLMDYLIRKSNDRKIAILITLAAVTGAYTLALKLDISGPLAMVVAGIFVGNKTRRNLQERKVQETLDIFWEMVDDILNAILFLLIGFELLTLTASETQIIAAVIAIPLVLLVRLITVSIPMKFFQLRRTHSPLMISILTWGGLRGGLAVALALALPPGKYRDFILVMTYSVVAFAIIVQGITIQPLARLATTLSKPQR